jgi:hypothetical protein
MDLLVGPSITEGMDVFLTSPGPILGVHIYKYDAPLQHARTVEVSKCPFIGWKGEAAP